jgi:hypothetical protein
MYFRAGLTEKSLLPSVSKIPNFTANCCYNICGNKINGWSID